MDERSVVGKDERILDVIHRHWTDLLPVAIFLLTIPIGTSIFDFLGAPWIGWILGLLFALFAVVAYRVHRANRLILTDKHLYEVQQFSLFDQKISTFNLARLQDVSHRRKGVFPTLLDYGELDVQTAATEENFVFYRCPKPKDVANWIMETHEIAKKRIEDDV